MRIRLSLCAMTLCCLLAPVQASEDLIVTFEIRARCAQFDRHSGRAIRQSRVVLEMSHEGRDITALAVEGQTRKLFVTHLGTMGRQQETIYLEQGRPIWVTRIETTYDAPLSGRAARRVEEWLYFESGHLIQRDFMPVTIVKGGHRIDEPWIHQTFIASPAQAREWKAVAREWQGKVADYGRALGAKE